jgi:DNA-directed RNA polymerase beta' subunit
MLGLLSLWHYLVADLIVLQEKMLSMLRDVFVVNNRRLQLNMHSANESAFMTMALARFGIPVAYVTETVLQIPQPYAERFLRRWTLVPIHVVDLALDMTVVPGMAELLATSDWPRGAPAIMSHLADFYEFGVRTNADPRLLREIHQALMADVFWDTIDSLTYREAAPGELVYDFTVHADCQSFMLGNGAFVHNTLNSVSWETPVRLFFAKAGGAVSNRVVAMGDFIDAEMDARPADVVRQDDGCEWIPLTVPTKVLSVDLHGQWSYEKVDAVSRHPVHNADGSEAVLQVTTLSGRVVVATYGESFLRYAPATPDNVMQRLEVTKGSELKIGDFLPVTFLHTAPAVTAKAAERNTSQDAFATVFARITAKWMAKAGLLHGRTTKTTAAYTFRGDAIVSLVRLPAPPVGANGRQGTMYDLTVANTKNFVLENGLAVRDTFHQAGAAKAGMTYGVPRMREIICGSKNISTPCMTLPLKRPFAHIKEAAENLARALPFTLLRNILASTDTVYEPDIMTSHLDTDVALVEQHAPFMEFIRERCCRWVVRFELCKMRSGARSLEPRGIADLIQEELADGALVIASRVTDTHWIIRVYLVDVESTVDHALKRSVETSTSTRMAPKRSSQRPSITSRKRRKFADLSHIPNIGASETVTAIPVPLHRIDAAVGRTTHSARDVIEWMLVRNTQQDLKNTLRVCGIPDIEGATVRLSERTDIDATTGSVRVVDEWVVDVHGSNFMQLAMLHPVDMGHIMSNHVMVIYDTLGVDAAGHVLFQELQACLNASGSRVDDRLIKLLVDVMTHHGFIMPISRHGLNRLVEHGVLAKITFEETLEMLFEAAALGHFDPLLGVSENVMVGRQPSLGTNLSKMYMERDGQRISCQRNTKDSTTTMPDTRIIMSVVTEHDEDDFVDEPLDAGTDLTLNWDRILTTRNTDNVQAAVGVTGTLVADATQLYEQQLYSRQFMSVTEAPELPPFRPGSPTFFMDEVGGIMSTCEPFRPASPVF